MGFSLLGRRRANALATRCRDRCRQDGGFSRYALALVPVVFVSGLGLVWLVLGRPWPTLSSPYERLRVLKLASIVGVLGLGALNKTYVARKLHQDPQTGL